MLGQVVASNLYVQFLETGVSVYFLPRGASLQRKVPFAILFSILRIPETLSYFIRQVFIIIKTRKPNNEFSLDDLLC